MKKNIWILNHYAGSMYWAKGGRHYYLAKYLIQNGYKPIIFASNIKHGTGERYFEYKGLFHIEKDKESGITFVFVKSCSYKDNGNKRILNMIDFYRNIKRTSNAIIPTLRNPDIIYASSVHPLTLVAGIQIAKKNHIKCISEVRDLWPESIVVYSKKFRPKGFIIKGLYYGEKWIYKKSDALIYTMAGGRQYIINKGWDTEQGGPVKLEKVYHINNGVDLEKFDKNIKDYFYEDPELDDRGIIKIVYTGSIRRVNNLGIILNAAKSFLHKNVRFLIWGTGDELERLKERVIEEGITCVKFKGVVEKKYIPSILSRADINLVHWETSSILKYGVSYNKLFEYLAAGKPIFSTVAPGYSLIKKYKCGIEAKNDSEKEITRSLNHLIDLDQDKKIELGKNARRASEDFDFKALTKSLINIIEDL